MINHVFKTFSAVQKYKPDGLIAQLVEHCTGIPEVIGSILVEA